MRLHIIFAAFALSISTLAFVACSEFGANSDFGTEKVAFLSRARIFGATMADADKYMPTAGTVAEQPVQEAPELPPVVRSVTGAAQVHGLCSQDLTNEVKTTLNATASPVAHVFNTSNQEVCSFDGTALRNRIVNMRRLSFENLATDCPSISSGQFFLTLTPPGSTKNLLYRGNALAAGVIPLQAAWVGKETRTSFSLTEDPRNGGLIAKVEGIPWALIDTNRNYSDTTISVANRDYTAAENTYPLSEIPIPPESRCEIRWSPLVVQISDGSNTRPIRLTPPTHGILFDILGGKADHQKINISWFADSISASYNYWIVLPNAAGQILGIDQMFGDNTMGPDGQYAANGFEALAKYDGRLNYFSDSGVAYSSRYRDSVIDKNDAIYSELRLWFDKNLDGKADTSEMVDLAKAGVDSIDLNFDSSFAEADIYGNQIKYKSVIKMRDGRMNIVYDLWFRRP